MWSADAIDSSDRYLAVFNLSNDPRALDVALLELGIIGRYTIRDLWARQEIGQYQDCFSAVVPSHGSGLYRLRTTYRNVECHPWPDGNTYDFATQRGLMVSPELCRKFLKPRYAKLLPDLIEIGMDVWETVQLHSLPISAEQLKREYGRDVTFFGGVNTQRLPFASENEVRDEVQRCIAALGSGGGYICGPDHHIKEDVSPDLTVALFDSAKTFQRQGYTLSDHVLCQ